MRVGVSRKVLFAKWSDTKAFVFKVVSPFFLLWFGFAS